MKKTYLLLATFGLLACSACQKDDPEEVDPSNPTPTEEPDELPETYIVIEGDTFYKSSSSVNPDPNAFRYQVNFSSAEQLDQTGNDGGTPATLGLVTTFKDKPLQTGAAPFSSSRFQMSGSDSVNFYITFFFNTGHPLESKNFLSPAGETLSFTIEDGEFQADLPPLSLFNEGDPSETALLNGGLLKLDW